MTWKHVAMVFGGAAMAIVGGVMSGSPSTATAGNTIMMTGFSIITGAIGHASHPLPPAPPK